MQLVSKCRPESRIAPRQIRAATRRTDMNRHAIPPRYTAFAGVRPTPGAPGLHLWGIRISALVNNKDGAGAPQFLRDTAGAVSRERGDRRCTAPPTPREKTNGRRNLSLPPAAGHTEGVFEMTREMRAVREPFLKTRTELPSRVRGRGGENSAGRRKILRYTSGMMSRSEIFSFLFGPVSVKGHGSVGMKSPE